MNSNFAWNSMLTQLDPEYEIHAHELNNSSISHTLTAVPEGWVFSVYKDWAAGYFSAVPLYERCGWIDSILKKWDSVTRLDFGHWLFNNKESADRFVTFYCLKWIT